MKTHNHHETLRRIDPDGRIVIGVMLSNAIATAWLFEEDYLDLVAKNGRCSWFLNSNGKGKSYVRLKGNHENIVQVSRLILGDTIKGSITYRDGNPLNLRTTNFLIKGPAPERKPKKPSKVQPLGSGLRIPVVAHG